MSVKNLKVPKELNNLVRRPPFLQTADQRVRQHGELQRPFNHVSGVLVQHLINIPHNHTLWHHRLQHCPCMTSRQSPEDHSRFRGWVHPGRRPFRPRLVKISTD